MPKPTPSTKDPSQSPNGAAPRKPAGARAAGKTVDDYLAGLPPAMGAVTAAACALVREIAPEAMSSIKWGQPVFELGGPLLYINAAKAHVTFGFWRGAELDDPEGRFEGAGDRMRHVKLRSLDDVRADRLGPWIRQAIALNQAKGDPSKRKKA